jgi:ABC-2 type transport system permease protein
VVLFSSLPLVFAAGFVWPLEALPQSIHSLALLVPSTSGIKGFLGLNQMGADFSMLIHSYTILWVQSVVYLGLAYVISSRKRRNTLSQRG